MKTKLPQLKLDETRAVKFEISERARAAWDASLKASKDEATINIFGEIADYPDAVSAKSIADQLAAIGNRPLKLNINSPGGSAFEGVAIYNLLREHTQPITANVIGMAASAASIIAMVGDTIQMLDGSLMMIHSVWGMAIGNKNDMRELANVFDKADREIAVLYSKRSGQSVEEVLRMMEDETWMNAAEAHDMGFADKVLEDPQKKKKQTEKASIDLAVLNSLARAASGERRAVYAALGIKSIPGASGPTAAQVPTKGKTMPATIKEHISTLENSLGAKAQRMEAIMTAKAESGELAADQAEEFDNLHIEIQAINKDLDRYRILDKVNVQRATPAKPDTSGTPSAEPQAAHYGAGYRIERNLPKGTAFTRYVQCLALSKGNLMQAAEMAKRYKSTTPEVGEALNVAVQLGSSALIQATAVTVGTTTDSTWALPLVNYEIMVNEFIELLRPATILGRIPGLRRVPFNIKVPRTTSGVTGGWVGEGAPKPVNKMAFDSITLGFSKVACITVLTEELVRFSSPSAEQVVRDELIAALSQLIDQSFVDPERTAVSGVSPASITNGATLVNATSSTTIAGLEANVSTLFTNLSSSTNNISLEGLVWIMNPRTAIALSMRRTTQDIRAYPDITPTGGFFFGYPVIVSGNIGIASRSANETYAILMQPKEIYVADDGAVEIDVSREASVQMNDAPSAGAQSLLSFWQNNLVGLRAERMINWARRRTAAVQVLDGLSI